MSSKAPYLPFGLNSVSVNQKHNKLQSVSPQQAAKTARRNKSSPYSIRQRGIPFELSNMRRALLDTYHPAHQDANASCEVRFVNTNTSSSNPS